MNSNYKSGEATQFSSKKENIVVRLTNGLQFSWATVFISVGNWPSHHFIYNNFFLYYYIKNMPEDHFCET